MRSALLISILLGCLAYPTFADPTKAPDGKEDSKPKVEQGTTSHLQIVYPPPDIYSNGKDSTAITSFAVRAQTEGLTNLKIVAGNLRDDDSAMQLTADAFELVVEPPKTKDQKALEGSISTKDLTRVTLRLRSCWQRAGKYSGSLWIGADGDSGAQSVPLKVYVRPNWVWMPGLIAIAAGALLSWFAIFWVSRQRQLAANEIVVVRLRQAVQGLAQILTNMASSGAPAAPQSLSHLNQILNDRLSQLMHDKELAVIAGVTMPAGSAVSVPDEIESMNRIVQHGFLELLRRWNAAPPNTDRGALRTLFGKMDVLGASAQPLATIDTQIQSILAQGMDATREATADQGLPPLPSEDAIVQRVIGTTYLLDVISLATIVLVGVYVLIWRNPGFGTFGNYIEAFSWGLGLKVGTDLTKLGPGDLKTSLGIKIPALPNQA